MQFRSCRAITDFSQEELKFFAQMKKALGMELKTENVFNALENIDEDGDKLISKEEIIAFCNKNPDALEVLGVASVEQLCVCRITNHWPTAINQNQRFKLPTRHCSHQHSLTFPFPQDVEVRRRRQWPGLPRACRPPTPRP